MNTYGIHMVAYHIMLQMYCTYVRLWIGEHVKEYDIDEPVDNLLQIIVVIPVHRP